MRVENVFPKRQTMTKHRKTFFNRFVSLIYIGDSVNLYDAMGEL